MRRSLRHRMIAAGPSVKFIYDIITGIASHITLAYCTCAHVLLKFEPFIIVYT